MSEPAPSPRLYYMPRTRSSRVLWLLEEIGERYEITQVAGDQRRSAEHLGRHPLGRVPALELADGTTMFESAVMCASVLQGANSRELLRPWPGLESYVQRGEARPAYARAAAISARPRT
jgi:hypothetical protein